MAQEYFLKIIEGPNKGDRLHLKKDVCRLIGRSISEDATEQLDPNANLELGATTKNILKEHLEDNRDDKKLSLDTLERGADILFSDDSMSRAHSMIFNDKDGVYIIDLLSTNGVFLNQKKVDFTEIKKGDIIRIGQTDILLEIE